MGATSTPQGPVLQQEGETADRSDHLGLAAFLRALAKTGLGDLRGHHLLAQLHDLHGGTAGPVSIHGPKLPKDRGEIPEGLLGGGPSVLVPYISGC